MLNQIFGEIKFTREQQVTALSRSLSSPFLLLCVPAGISARNLSARQGLDFSGAYARQVQFNPGQAEAEWRLRLLDDGVFERREEFLVVLGQALMTATESPDKAVVTVHDAEDGMLPRSRDIF
ncbi:hypothetical protein HPB48_009454 [Haemaphysalis longicornis]|uniref:Calx-beta domain-containing protein n=1 Tax=Haemaphysalis longicornis TaxID=44386 RepID=A0A9J6GF64_HAELO|nr:hypothetical protein HPB48_009454 [Haemaphysalis longicornis]